MAAFQQQFGNQGRKSKVSCVRGYLHESIILAGGKGERLKSVISHTPKPMANVAGKPFLEWLILALKKQGIRNVILSTGYLSELIEHYFGDGKHFGMEILYCVNPYPLGTGGAIRNALNLIKSNCFLVLNGDSFCDFDLEQFYNFHLEKKSHASILLTEVKDSGRFGSVIISDNGEVLSFREKTAINEKGLINAGVYILEKASLESAPQNQAISLEKEIFPALIGKGLYAIVNKSIFCDIGTPESYNDSCKLLTDKFKSMETEV